MGVIKYDPAIMNTPEGQILNEKWHRIRKNTDSPEFKEFMGFYNWAMEAGFKEGDKLFRRNKDLPFSPENCVWVEDANNQHWDAETKNIVKRWNDFVNRVRKANGMEPLKGTEDVEEEAEEDVES